MGEGAAEAAGPRHAARRPAAPGRRHLRRVRRLAGRGPRRGGVRAAEPGPLGARPPPEPGRVRQRGPRPAGGRDRRPGAAAGRRRELRVRQHRRRPHDVATAARALPLRRPADQPPGGRRPGRWRRRGDLRRVAQLPPGRPDGRGAAVRHARRHHPAPHLPARRRVRHPHRAAAGDHVRPPQGHRRPARRPGRAAPDRRAPGRAARQAFRRGAGGHRRRGREHRRPAGAAAARHGAARARAGAGRTAHGDGDVPQAERRPRGPAAAAADPQLQPQRRRGRPAGHRLGHHRRAVRRRRRGGVAQPPADLHLPPGGRRRRGALRRAHPVRAGPARLPPPGERDGRRAAAARLPRPAAGRRRLRHGHPGRPGGRAREPALPLPGRARSAGSRLRDALSPGRPGAGVAPVVLSVEQHSRRRVAGAGRAGPAGCARRAGGAGAADAGGRARGGAGGELLRAVAVPAQPGPPAAGRGAVPGLRRRPARRVPPRDRAVSRQPAPRGPQRGRPAAGAVHVPERAAGRLLRGAERLRQPLPAGEPARRAPGRAAGTRQRPDGHLLRQPHLAGAAREVRARGHPGRPAAAPAAGRAGAGGCRRGGAAPLDARAAGAASPEPRLRDLPREDRSARLRAGELRSDRRLAGDRQRRGGGRVGDDRRRRVVRRPASSSGRRCSRARTCSSPTSSASC